MSCFSSALAYSLPPEQPMTLSGHMFPTPGTNSEDAVLSTMALVCIRAQGTAHPGQHTRADHPQRRTALGKVPRHGSERVRSGVRLAGPCIWVSEYLRCPSQ